MTRYLILFLPLLLFGPVWGQDLVSELPVLVITTGGQELSKEEYASGTLRIAWDSTWGMNTSNGPFTHFSGPVQIRHRGNSTLEFDKKPFALKLGNSLTHPAPASLLGLPPESDWILHPMYIDKTLLRIPLTFYFSQRMGHYASRWRFTELMLDGQYQGVYLLVEKIKIAPDRVNIQPLGPVDYSGGYLLKLDWNEGGGGFNSEYDAMDGTRLRLQYYEPKGRVMTGHHKDYLKSWFTQFEDALFAKDFRNAQGEHYKEYLDRESFADFLLINELSKNSDGYKLSTFMHKDSDHLDGRIKAGPIWDFDQTYGHSEVCSGADPCGWLYLQNQGGCEDLSTMPMWWEALTRDPVFCHVLEQRWQRYRTTFLHEDSIETWIDSVAGVIAPARERNFDRWPILGESVWEQPEPIPEDYQAEIAYLKTWIRKRIDWMDRNIVALKTWAPHHNRVVPYPNPTTGEVHIEAIPGSSIRICDLAGKVVWSREECAESSYRIDASNWAPGCYLIYVTTGQGSFAGKLIVR